MTDVIRTVLGDVPPELLGRTDYHEHLLQATPLLPGDELDDVDRSADEAGELRGEGIDALVELTPIGLGRDPHGLRSIAHRSGLRVVMATGVHRSAHYADDHPVRGWDESTLTATFINELTCGVTVPTEGCTPDPARVRAGVIKVGVGYWGSPGIGVGGGAGSGV